MRIVEISGSEASLLPPSGSEFEDWGEVDPGSRSPDTIHFLIETAEGVVVGDMAAYLQEDMECQVAVYQDVPVSIELPQRVTLEIVETEPVTKGQTASSSYKPAVLSNGVRTAVPPFIGIGTRIVVQTEDGSYVERAKD